MFAISRIYWWTKKREAASGPSTALYSSSSSITQKRHIAAGADHIERQRQVIERLDAGGHGHSTTADNARTLLATVEQAQVGRIADRNRIKRLLAKWRWHGLPSLCGYRRGTSPTSSTSRAIGRLWIDGSWS